MTNLIILVSVVTTNWVNFPGDFKREDGTNYVRQYFMVQTNTFIEEISMCTNRTLFKQTTGTNGPVRWSPVSQITPLPGIPGKQ